MSYSGYKTCTIRCCCWCWTGTGSNVNFPRKTGMPNVWFSVWQIREKKIMNKGGQCIQKFCKTHLIFVVDKIWNFYFAVEKIGISSRFGKRRERSCAFMFDRWKLRCWWVYRSNTFMIARNIPVSVCEGAHDRIFGHLARKAVDWDLCFLHTPTVLCSVFYSVFQQPPTTLTTTSTVPHSGSFHSSSTTPHNVCCLLVGDTWWVSLVGFVCTVLCFMLSHQQRAESRFCCSLRLMFVIIIILPWWYVWRSVVCLVFAYFPSSHAGFFFGMTMRCCVPPHG